MNTSAENFMNTYTRAFPTNEDEIVFQHANSTAQSSFSICRICGSLVLASMQLNHLNEIHLSD